MCLEHIYVLYECHYYYSMVLFWGLWFLYLFILICFHLQGAHIIPSLSGAVMDLFFLENVFSVIF